MSSHGSSTTPADDGEKFETNAFFIGPSSIDSHTSLEDSQEHPSLCKHHEKSRPSLAHFWPSSKHALSGGHSDLRKHQSVANGMDGYLALGAIRLIENAQDATNRRWLMLGSRREFLYPVPTSPLALGEKRQWLKTELVNHPSDDRRACLRVFALPEDVNRSSRGSVKDLRKVLKFVTEFIDTSSHTWNGNYDPDSPIQTYDAPPSTQEESLFYIFNTLSSPKVSFDSAGNCPYSQQSMGAVLDDTIDGLRTPLYPYQKRSVAAMLQKEANPAKLLDPRKARFHDLRGDKFYFDVLEGVLLVNPHFYSEPQGGILAETMGYGKTLICIALILSTRGHYPKLPEGRLDTLSRNKSNQTPSLLELAAKKVKHVGAPWKSHFATLERHGYQYDQCIEAINKHDVEFAEPIFNPITPNRRHKKREDFRILRLCYATLLIVPPNLLIQWKNEIEKHTQAGSLDVLVLESSVKELPPCQTLMKYDIVLITKARFDQEYRDDDLNQGKRMYGKEKFRSPLTEVRWLRVICDEGHSFAGSSYRTHAMAMLDKMSIERRWVVSGTPSHSLHGVEISLALDGNSELDSSRSSSIEQALERRKLKDPATEEIKDMERLRVMVVKFFKLQPWANQKGADYADWKKYLSPFDADGKRRFAPALREVLQSLIVRHRIEDIDLDLCLPPLHNTTVYLEPTYYDKLSMNMFRMVLTSNAITSERVDEDYMFHPRNRKFLDDLVNNLRHSSFHWVGFSEHEVTETLRVSNTYLDKNIDQITDVDGRQLTEAILNGERALKDPGWRAFSFFHEIGVYVEGFPEHARKAWALHGEDKNPLLLGTVQAREAQQCVLKKLDFEDPTDGLTGAGLRAMRAARERATEEQEERNKKSRNASGKSPTAGASNQPKVKNQSTSSSSSVGPPSTTRPSSSRSLQDLFSTGQKRPRSISNATLPSSLSKTTIVGFTSAKLNYLCSRILSLQQNEKIVIFYDSNNIAFWIAEALELLSVKFLIYANTLSVNRRAAYLATFNQSEVFRVLLMDLKQASHGLHVASASRVFIVSPIWQPSIESQAIKRAHRIGQTKPVYVETLVLKGTLEEKILQRRRQMSNAELVKAEKSLLDDGTMNGIIRAEGFLKIADGEEEQLLGGRLESPVPLFERKDALGGGLEGGQADDDLILSLEDEDTTNKKAKKTTRGNGKGKAVAFGLTETTGKAMDVASSPSPALPSSIFGGGFSLVSQPEKPKKSVRIAVEGSPSV
ncbi:hypothetical protein LTR47_010419 [Exophiala xenobiotica]|nr:hypothetical protein LTR41_000626 [Exophiala xenobiotica]KAK5223165.1 hypothetical protein LTR47_010419 [Exophiala xenobiotica]KAK5226810.1 hypothetical protein LTR72_002799 [Exophiala xenobiotica]KAK5254783.1 hypothetical protein LTS06_000922 [Exophiala xenobiotica]KAK5282931.1 hypothetical protein LTR40_002537 [Exophiala xenobiotica]